MAVDANGCEIVKIDSNVTGLAIAEELCLKQLPATPVWFAQSPNSYSDFGSDTTKVARTPISQSRQNLKGVTADIDATGGFNADFTKTSLNRMIQGFMCSDARERFTTQPMNGAPIAVGEVVGSTKTVDVVGASAIGAGTLALLSGFGVAANNGVNKVASSNATEIVFTGAMADEAAPPATAKIETVGFGFAAADAQITVAGGVVSLKSTAATINTIPGLIPGMWVYVDGFVNNKGFARIGQILAKELIFDETTWSGVTEAAAGLTVNMYFGTVFKNEATSNLIKMRSYQLERQLGEGVTGTQAEYLEGAFANELTLNIPLSEKLNVDLGFIACDHTFKTGEVGDEVKTGTRVPFPSDEDAFNSSSDVYRQKMSIAGQASNRAALFGYVTEADLTVTNNVSPIKVIGTMGAVSASFGNFEVTGNITALFTEVAAVQAVRNNADVGFYSICAQRNSGFVFDIPLLGLSGGRLNVEKDQPITLPLETAGAQNKNGYTMLYEYFPYLPF